MRSDFIKAGSFVTLEVKHSKTIQCRERSYTIKLPILNTSLCAFSALLRAFQKLWLPPNSPAFVMDSAGTPLTGPAFNKRLKELVALCGEDAGMFGSHSFRRGSATWALCCGVPGEVVKLWETGKVQHTWTIWIICLNACMTTTSSCSHHVYPHKLP